MAGDKNKTQEFRGKVAERFIAALEEDPLVWRKGWNTINTLPANAVTDKKYKGINQLSLYIISLTKKYSDPRFATFKQIQDKGWKLNNAKGTGIQVEYWFPYDQKSKKYCGWDEYKEWTETGDPNKDIILLPKYHTVFNAKHIEGIPALERPEMNESISVSDLIPKMCKNMGIEILNDGGNEAYYSLKNDNIHMPAAGCFLSQAEYDATCTHELSHATGAAHRLHRFEESILPEQRSMEELVAEISSSFLSVHFQQPAAPMVLSGPEMENHMAYVQSWIEEIKDKPETLMKAIKEAEKAANYLELQAEIISEKEYEHTQGKTAEISENQLSQKTSLEMLLEKMKNGLTEEDSIKFIKQTPWNIESPTSKVFIMQQAEYIEGEWGATLTFHSNFDPQVFERAPSHLAEYAIGTCISLGVYPVDRENAGLMRESKHIKLWGENMKPSLNGVKMRNKSLQTAQKTYLNTLEKWKELTGQEKIQFPHTEQKPILKPYVPEV